MKELIRTILLEYRNNIQESNIIDIDKICPDADEITEEKVYPVINDLFRGINKIKRNQFDKLTDGEKSNIFKIFPNIINKKTKEFNKNFKVDFDNSIIVDDFIYIYNLKTLKGDNKKVSVSLFYDNDELAYAFNGMIFINVKKIDLNNLNSLKSTIRHELIHMADPKAYDEELRSKIDVKYKTPTHDDYTSYVKLGYEFDSFSHELITTIKNNLDSVSDDNENKTQIIKDLWSILDLLKTKTQDYIIDKFETEAVIRLFTPNGIKSKNNIMLRKNFFQTLSIFDGWKTKPTLYNTFYKRLARFVPYLK